MLYTIPGAIGFVDALAEGLLARRTGPMGLAHTLVLLPNRRAVRALTEAFVRRCGTGGLLLPRLVPVGDLDEDGFDRLAAGELLLPPPISPLQRQLELGRLVRQRSTSASAVEALRLGSALADTLDLLQAEEIPPERLRDAVADADLAHHWQDTLAFLEIIITAWPDTRDQLGGSDGGTRLSAAIDDLIKRWHTAPPKAPVIAAGLTGTTPALARLLAAVLKLPAGDVILPGLDTEASEAADARFEAITCAAASDEPPMGRDREAHPQYALKLLLARLGWARDEVQRWPFSSERDGPPAREAELMAAFAPADTGEGYSTASENQSEALAAFKNVQVIEADTPAEEAQALALALREVLETPGRTAALVTPDRALARRVAAHCRRWGLVVDDSAGQPLTRTPPATLALAMVAAVAEHFAPVPLLALLKHPLVNAGDARLPWLDRVRALDLALRGVRPAPGLDGISAHIDAWLAERRREGPHEDRSLATWWAEVAALLTPLEALDSRGGTDLPTLSLALQTAGETLAGEALWSGPEGRALSERLEALALEGAVFGSFGADEAPALLTALFADVAVRPAWGGHPRIAILGPLEAQLARADLMIVAGLNEGIWPAQPRPDPWLAPAIRARLKLPGQAREMGLAAADFVRALGAPHVLISRARRDASGPLLPSRLLQRLDAHIAALGSKTSGLTRETRLIMIARGLDAADKARPVARPHPSPPAEARPPHVSVTAIDTLIADPFAFYARRILKLRVLDPLDADPGAADKGQLLHEVMEDWINSESLDPARLESLCEAMLLKNASGFPLLGALWGPRARRALAWAGEQVLARQSVEGGGWQPVAAEAKGEIELANGIRLTGTADRVDRNEAGEFAIIDYKSGGAPTVAKVREMLMNQLPLLAALAQAGAMKGKRGPVGAAPVSALEYWRLSGGEAVIGKATPALGTKDAPPIADHVTDTLDFVTSLTSKLLLGAAPFTAQLHPALSWPDYDHLARVQEWRNTPPETSGPESTSA